MGHTGQQDLCPGVSEPQRWEELVRGAASLGDEPKQVEEGIRVGEDRRLAVHRDRDQQSERLRDEQGCTSLTVREESHKNGTEDQLSWCWTGDGRTGVNSRFSLSASRQRNKYRCA